MTTEKTYKFLNNNEILDGCASLEEVNSYEEWLDFEKRGKEKYKENYVPSSVFLAIRIEDNKLTLTFPAIDDIFKGKYRSRVGVILGYGGAKKSMFGQNVCSQNVINNNDASAWTEIVRKIDYIYTNIDNALLILDKIGIRI